MPNPIISILLPFYNPELSLFKRAVESIINQRFTGWELLLINNNSEGNSLAWAKQISQSDPRIQLITERNQGIAYALNTGLKHAQASLIARMDADDECHPDRLFKQEKHLRENPQIDAVACQTEFQSNLPKSEGYQTFVQWQNSILTPEQHFNSQFIESPVAHPTMIFRKKLIDTYGAYSTDPIPEDYELWLRWMAQGVQMAKIPEKLFIWQDHGQRLSRNHKNYHHSAFDIVKFKYLCTWLKTTLKCKRKIIVCGRSADCKKRAQLMSLNGIDVFAYTDVKAPINPQYRFIPIEDLHQNPQYFIINLITKRGVGTSIRQYLTSKGLKEMEDFVLAG